MPPRKSKRAMHDWSWVGTEARRVEDITLVHRRRAAGLTGEECGGKKCTGHRCYHFEVGHLSNLANGSSSTMTASLGSTISLASSTSPVQVQLGCATSERHVMPMRFYKYGITTLRLGMVYTQR